MDSQTFQEAISEQLKRSDYLADYYSLQDVALDIDPQIKAVGTAIRTGGDTLPLDRLKSLNPSPGNGQDYSLSRDMSITGVRG